MISLYIKLIAFLERFEWIFCPRVQVRCAEMHCNLHITGGLLMQIHITNPEMNMGLDPELL